MKKIILSCLGLLILSGCSGNQPETTDSTSSTRESVSSSVQESTMSSSSSSSSTISTAESSENTETTAPSTTESAPTAVDIQTQLLDFLNQNYPLNGAHYQISFSFANTDTGRDEYQVAILPDSVEDDAVITSAFRNGGPDSVEITNRIETKARDFTYALPQNFTSIHIYNVEYISYDGSYQLTVVHDRAQDAIR